MVRRRLRFGKVPPAEHTSYRADESSDEISSLGDAARDVLLQKSSEEPVHERKENRNDCGWTDIHAVTRKRVNQGHCEPGVSQEVEEFIRSEPAELRVAAKW